MASSETRQFLHADIKEWSYRCDCSNLDVTAGQPLSILQLYGSTNQLFANFASHLPIQLELFCNESPSAAEYCSPSQVSVIENLEEHCIPLMLAGSLLLPKQYWLELKKTLQLAATEHGYSVSVQIETQENTGRPSESESERNFAVFSFGFALHHSMGAK